MAPGPPTRVGRAGDALGAALGAAVAGALVDDGPPTLPCRPAKEDKAADDHKEADHARSREAPDVAVHGWEPPGGTEAPLMCLSRAFEGGGEDPIRGPGRYLLGQPSGDAALDVGPGVHALTSCDRGSCVGLECSTQGLGRVVQPGLRCPDRDPKGVEAVSSMERPR